MNNELIKLIKSIEKINKAGEPMETYYHVFQILKRSGRGYRTICAPCEELKKIQRAIYKIFIKPRVSSLNIRNTSSHGFTQHRSILTNATSHGLTLKPLHRVRSYYNKNLGSWTFTRLSTRQLGKSNFIYMSQAATGKVGILANKLGSLSGQNKLLPDPTLQKAILLKFDIKDAFGSINEDLIFKTIVTCISTTNYITNKTPWETFSDYKIAGILTSMCMLWGGLPQGAPTSPAILNMALFDFDSVMKRNWSDQLISQLHLFCMDNDSYCSNLDTALSSAKYTRYADDITISILMTRRQEITDKTFPRISISKVFKAINKHLSKYNLRLNPKKSRLFSNKRGFRVCGITLGGASITVSRKQVNNLRARMNNIIDNYINGNLTDEQFAHEKFGIQGQLSFVASADYAKASGLWSFIDKRIIKAGTSLRTNAQRQGQRAHSIHKKLADLRQFCSLLAKSGKRRLDSPTLSEERELRRLMHSGGAVISPPK